MYQRCSSLLEQKKSMFMRVSGRCSGFGVIFGVYVRGKIFLSAEEQDSPKAKNLSPPEKGRARGILSKPWNKRTFLLIIYL
jgi:hypothetical protein